MNCPAAHISPASLIGEAEPLLLNETEFCPAGFHPDVEALGTGFPLAILEPRYDLSAGKTFRYESGEWKKHSDYGKAKWFICHLRAVIDLLAWHDLLTKIAHDNVFLVMGLPLENANLSDMVRRSRTLTSLNNGRTVTEPETLMDRPCSLLPFDFDSTECPDGIDIIKNPDEAIAWLIKEKLPVPFHGAGVVYQFSSSFGLSNNKLKVHLFFWLKDPVTMATAKDWAKSYNLRHGYTGSGGNVTKIVDDAVYQPQQPIYTKQRECLGAPDPVPVMIGHIPGNEVDFLPALDEQTSWAHEELEKKRRSGQCQLVSLDSRGSGKGIEAHLADIGVSGHHAPIRNAAAAMVATYGKAEIEANIDRHIERLHAVVNAADRMGKSESDFSSYLSGAYLRQQFTSAINKGFGDGTRSRSPEKSANVLPQQEDFPFDEAVLCHQFPDPFGCTEIEPIECATIDEGRAALAVEIAIPGNRVVICPTGLGKSHAALDLVRTQSLSSPVIVTAPTLALAKELFDRYDGPSAIMASGRNDENCTRYKEVKAVTARGYDPGATVCLECREYQVDPTDLSGGNLGFSLCLCEYDQLIESIRELKLGVVFGATAQLRLLRHLMAGSETNPETEKRKNYSVLCVIDEPSLNQLQDEVSFTLKKGIEYLEEALRQLPARPEYRALIEALEELLEVCDRVSKGRTLRTADEYSGGYLFVVPENPPLGKGAALADRLDINDLRKVISAALEALNTQDLIDNQFMLHIKGFDRRMILFLQLLAGQPHFDTCFLKIDQRKTTVVMQSTAWCKRLPVRTTELLLLDATASPGVAQAIFGRPFREVKISCPVEWKHQEHIHAFNSKTYLQELSGRQLAQKIQAWLMSAARHLRVASKILCCCFMMIEKAMRAQLERAYPNATIEVAHYGAIRGLDMWKDYDTVILVGNPLWPAEALFIDGCAIFGDDHLSREAWAAVQARDELTQAAGRVRAINAPGQKTLLYVGGQWPWPETKPDHLVIIPHGNVGDEMAEALNRSFEWLVLTEKTGCRVLNREVGLLLNILTPGLPEQEIARYGGKLQEEIAPLVAQAPYVRDLSTPVLLTNKQWSRLVESVARRCTVQACEHKGATLGGKQFAAAVGTQEDVLRFLKVVDGVFLPEEWHFDQK